jgi:glycosyltransferase involved in cell wall biosynthesis
MVRSGIGLGTFLDEMTDISIYLSLDTGHAVFLMDAELISIIIPSLNEERHIGMALQSIKDQDYKDVEVILVDSFSKDRTKEIAAGFGAKVVDYPGRLLGARVEGLKASRGGWIMHIDADQVMQPGALSRCLVQMQDHDMVVLGERSYKPTNWVQRELDRQRLFFETEAMNGGEGFNVYPRLFKRHLLEHAYSQIPGSMIPTMGSFEDSLVYSKVREKSTDSVIVPDAVWHNEESNAIELYRHQRSIGRRTRAYRDQIKIDSFHRSKSKTRGMIDALSHRYLLVSMIKELGFQVGYRF